MKVRNKKMRAFLTFSSKQISHKITEGRFTVITIQWNSLVLDISHAVLQGPPCGEVNFSCLAQLGGVEGVLSEYVVDKKGERYIELCVVKGEIVIQGDGGEECTMLCDLSPILKAEVVQLISKD
ncbi:hypothetical protein KKH43_05545 [Patescibacteria group bacterium]|nr:hypothetical protein [Patescibacteria group bacterium]